MNINTCFLNKSLLKHVKNVTLVQKSNIYNRSRIGNRDWVGWGKNGKATYADDPMYPFPAVRFKENSNELLALREKEKGDWRKLSIDEKKCLYRASFRQTLAEAEAPTGIWKSIIGLGLIFISIGLWLGYAVKWNAPPLPHTFSEENRRAVLRKKIDMKLSPVAQLWDYDNDDWKK